MNDEVCPVVVLSETLLDGPDDTAVIEQAATVLADGGVVVVPTDTVYGVAASIRCPEAIRRLFVLKGRPSSNPLAVLVADLAQASTLVDLDRIPSTSREAVHRWTGAFWPGALTVVLPRSVALRQVDLGGPVAGGGSAEMTVGVRCPASPVVRALAERVGPLVTTSANRSGDPTPRTASAAAQSLAGAVDLVLDGGSCTQTASTVVDMTVFPPRMLREGPIRREELGLGDDDA